MQTDTATLPPSSRRRPEEYEEALLAWQASRSAADLADFLRRTSYASDLYEEVKAHLTRASRPTPADDLLALISTASRVILEIPGGGLHGFLEVWAVAWAVSALAISSGDTTDAEAAIAHLDACGARSLDRIRSAVFAAEES